MEQRLFIITNDTHYLNVRKYIASHPIGENFIFLLVNPFEGYSDLLKKIRKNQDLIFLEVIFSPKQQKFPFHYLGIFNIMRRIKKLKNKARSFDKVFFTNYSSWIQHYIINQYSNSQKVYISDGTSIFPIAERRKTDKTIPFLGSKFFAEHILKLKSIPNLHFFSPIKIDLPENDSLELFTYDISSKATIDNKKIFFVGGPLIEMGKFKKKANLDYMERLRKSFSSYKIYYFAHRRENQENLDSYSFFDEIKKDNLSFEERLAHEKELPSKVISYVSSVLVNLAPVYPQVEFLYISLKPQDIPDGNEFGSRYESLKKHFKNVEVDNLKELII